MDNQESNPDTLPSGSSASAPTQRASQQQLDAASLQLLGIRHLTMSSLLHPRSFDESQTPALRRHFDTAQYFATRPQLLKKTEKTNVSQETNAEMNRLFIWPDQTTLVEELKKNDEDFAENLAVVDCIVQASRPKWKKILA